MRYKRKSHRKRRSRSSRARHVNRQTSRMKRRSRSRKKTVHMQGGAFDNLPPELNLRIGEFLGTRQADRVPHLAQLSQVNKASHSFWNAFPKQSHQSVESAAATFVRRIYASQTRGVRSAATDVWNRICEYVQAFSDDDLIKFLHLILEVVDLPSRFEFTPTTMLCIWNSGKTRFSNLFTERVKASNIQLESMLKIVVVALDIGRRLVKGHYDDCDRLTAHYGSICLSHLTEQVWRSISPSLSADIQVVRFFQRHLVGSAFPLLTYLKVATQSATMDFAREVLQLAIPQLGVPNLFLVWGNLDTVKDFVAVNPELPRMATAQGKVKFDIEFGYALAAVRGDMKNPSFWVRTANLYNAGLIPTWQSANLLLVFLRNIQSTAAHAPGGYAPFANVATFKLVVKHLTNLNILNLPNSTLPNSNLPNPSLNSIRQLGFWFLNVLIPVWEKSELQSE